MALGVTIQQECRSMSTSIVCAVAVCTVHSSTEEACQQTLYCFFQATVVALNCRMRHLHGGDSLNYSAADRDRL